MNLGVMDEAAPNAASSNVARYSRAARTASSLSSSGLQSLLGTERCLLASAALSSSAISWAPSSRANGTMVPSRSPLVSHRPVVSSFGG
jgi:hypothetical protein